MKIRKIDLEKLKIESKKLKINFNILIELREYFGSIKFLKNLRNTKKLYEKYNKNKDLPNSFDELKIFLEKIFEFRKKKWN